MSGEVIMVRELEERYLTLSRLESDFLLRRHARHMALRPAPGGRGRWLLRAADCCGVIALPDGRALHIEPKAEIANLWRLLTTAYELVELGEQRVGLATAADLLESLAAIFISRCERIIAAGPLHGYLPREEDLRALRGRLDVTRSLRRQPRARHLLACRYDDYSADVIENRILRWTLHRLGRASFSTDRGLRARAEHWAARLAPVTLVPVSEYDFSLLSFDNLNRHYRTPLALAELLLGALGVTHRPGACDLPPLLLDMPAVFERFVAGLLGRALRGSELRARTRAHSTVLDDDGRMVLTPDVLITRGDQPVCVVDAKYKRAVPGSSWRGPQAADVYQMLAYCVGYEVTEALLVYPERLQDGSAGPSPLRVTRPGLSARVHCFGLDLSGTRSAFDAACGRLVEVVARLAAPVAV